MRRLKLPALLLLASLASGCEIVWTVPPARGRVLDSRSEQPISFATVTRIATDTTNQTVSDANGDLHFRGKRSIHVFPFGDVIAAASYRIEAGGYQALETNRTGWGSMSGLRHDFGEITLSPR
jgi:hypothetical protein